MQQIWSASGIGFSNRVRPFPGERLTVIYDGSSERLRRVANLLGALDIFGRLRITDARDLGTPSSVNAKAGAKRTCGGDEFWGTARTRRNAKSDGGGAADVAGFCCVVNQEVVGILKGMTLPTKSICSQKETDLYISRRKSVAPTWLGGGFTSLALGVSGQHVIRCGERTAVAAVQGVERVVVLGAGLVLVTGDFERRVDEQVVGGRDGVGQGAEVNRNAIRLLGVGDFVLLRDIGDLREITVGIGR